MTVNTCILPILVSIFLICKYYVPGIYFKIIKNSWVNVNEIYNYVHVGDLLVNIKGYFDIL